MATKLGIYNGALRLCKARRLSALTDNSESRRLLDAAWGTGATDGAVRYCLEAGQWTFATRTIQVEYDPNLTPTFGYRYAFEQPDDMLRPTGVFQDEMCQVPLLDYSDERRYWFANINRIWVKVISSLDEYGGDMSLWSEMFVKMLEAYLANEIVVSICHSDQDIARVERMWTQCKLEAKSLDAMNKPTVMLPRGRWNMARMSRIDDYRSKAR